MSQGAIDYTGSAIKPTPGVTVNIPSEQNKTTLEAGTDFEYSYGDNTNAGTNAGSVTITAKDGTNYTGSKTVNFNINKIDNTLNVTANTITYNTQEQELVSQTGAQGDVYYSIGTELTESNYSEAGTKNEIPKGTNAGEYTVYYYAPGNGNYNATNGSANVTIGKYDLSNATIANINAQNYTGSAITPTPGVTVNIPSEQNKTTLEVGTDFEYSYGDNTNAGTNAGSITITAKDNTNYTGSKTVNFNINKIDNTLNVIANTITYNAQEQELVSQTGAQGDVYYSIGTELTESNYSEAGTKNEIPKGTNAGEYTVYYYAPGNGNYNATNGSANVTIEKYALSNATIANIDAQNYTGSAIKPTLGVTVPLPNGNTTTLTNDTDFIYSYSSNTNPTNSAQVTVTAKDESNYTGSKSISFTINPRIVFKSNAGKGSMSNQYVPYNTNTALTENAFIRDGYIFGKWNTKADGTGTNYNNGATIKTTKNITLYAQWTANTYTLTFNANDGEVSTTTKSVEYGTTYTDLPTPTKQGYSFAGWYTTFNGSSDYINYGRDYMYTDKISIHVSAYMENWSQYNSGMRIISCTQSGGWNIESSGGKIVFANYCSGVNYANAISSITWESLTSGWHDFDLVFDGEYTYGYLDGTKIATSAPYTNIIKYHANNSILVGAEAGAASIPAGEYFNGYIGNIVINHSDELISSNTYNTISAPAQDLALYAKWIPNTNTPYTVKHYFMDTTGNYTEDPVVEELTGITDAKVTPEVKTEYGTQGFKVPQTQEVTIKADGTTVVEYRYERNKVTIYYNANGGQLIEPHSSSYTGIDEEGYIIVNNERKSRTILYYGGSTSNSGLPNYNYKSGINLKKSGYIAKSHEEWNTKADGTGTYYDQGDKVWNASDFADVSSGDIEITLYVNWYFNPLMTINYYANGAEKDYDEDLTEDLLLTKTYRYNSTNWSGKNGGPDYIGSTTTWNLSKTGYHGTAYWIVGSPTSETRLSVNTPYPTMKDVAEAMGLLDQFNQGDITVNLYAEWIPDTYTITYNLDGGNVEGNNPESYTIESENITLINPTKTGYIFDGWTGSNGDTPQTTVTIPQGSTGNKTYTTHWTANTYNITLDKQSGTGGTSTIYETYGTKYSLTSGGSGEAMTTSENPINVPTRSGYEFKGYYTETNGGGTQYINKDGYLTGTASTTNFDAKGTLYAYWKRPVYEITLDNQEADTEGTDKIYLTYTVKYSITPEGNAMTTSDNPITIPTKSGYVFMGYYNTSAETGGTQYINKNGYRTSSASLTGFNTNGTLYARWQKVYLRVSETSTSGTTAKFLYTTIERRKIKSITFENSIAGHTVDGTKCFDVSSIENSGQVLLWVTNTDENGYYDIVIGQNGGVKANPDSSYLFSYVGYTPSTFTISFTNFINTANVTNMSNMFQCCGYTGMTSLNLGSNFDTSSVTSMKSMFLSCGYTAMTSLDLGEKFDTSSVTNMNSMFSNCGYTAMTSLDLGEKFDTSSVIRMDSMFSYCGYTAMTSLDLGEKFDTSSVTYMGNMFSYCGYKAMTSLDLGEKFDTSSVTNMSYMFSYCGRNAMTSLDLGEKFDTSSVTDMSSMFSYCGGNAMTSLDLGEKFDTSSVTSMKSMFLSCGRNAITSLDLGEKFDTSSVTNMQYMFNSCPNLVTIYATESFVTTNVTNGDAMFSGDDKLVGGMGTTFSSSHIDHAYAHVDEGTTNPGYFTDKNT